MILLVPSVILALLVLAWIAWIAFEPRSSAISAAPPGVNPLLGGIPSSGDTADGAETDFQRHIRNRIEESQLPLGTVAGASLPDGGRITHRATDDPKCAPKSIFGTGEFESHANAISRARLN